MPGWKAGAYVVIQVLCSFRSAEPTLTAARRERKNMNLPGVVVDLPTLTAKDLEDLQGFAVSNKVDFIAASFVRKPEDLKNVRDALGDAGSAVQIISKIENQEGIQNFEDILRESDGIMARRRLLCCACALVSLAHGVLCAANLLAELQSIIHCRRSTRVCVA